VETSRESRFDAETLRRGDKRGEDIVKVKGREVAETAEKGSVVAFGFARGYTDTAAEKGC
jgi:hypothetical protein